MVIEKVITVELNEMSRILRFEEKRICCIGLINLTVETADYLGYFIIFIIFLYLIYFFYFLLNIILFLFVCLKLPEIAVFFF